jgi:hypothetical protein
MRICTTALVAVIFAFVLAGCGSSTPTDVALLRKACQTPPSSSVAYDWGYETIDPHNVVTGVALCGSDGSVARWALYPAGNGDQVHVYASGIAGP